MQLLTEIKETDFVVISDDEKAAYVLTPLRIPVAVVRRMIENKILAPVPFTAVYRTHPKITEARKDNRTVFQWAADAVRGRR